MYSRGSGVGNDEGEIKLFWGFLRMGWDGKGLAGCGGLSGGLQRLDNQLGFILTFLAVHIV